MNDDATSGRSLTYSCPAPPGSPVGAHEVDRIDVQEERGGATVLTRIDHVMICVPDLARGIDSSSRIGFNIYPGGAHAGRGTHNAIAFQQEDYLELLSLRDRETPVVPGSSEARLAEFLARGGGFRYVAIQSDD